jgi:hypothetical protein
MSKSSVSHFSSYKILFLLALLEEATTNVLESNVDKMAGSTNHTTSENTSVHWSWKGTKLLKKFFFSVQRLICNGTVLFQVSGTVFTSNLTAELTRMMTRRTHKLFFLLFPVLVHGTNLMIRKSVKKICIVKFMF